MENDIIRSNRSATDDHRHSGSNFHGCGGYFPDGKEQYNVQNTITIAEMLKAWTYGGAYNIGMEDKLGTLEAGKLADIAVLDRNVFEVPMSEMRDVKVP